MDKYLWVALSCIRGMGIKRLLALKREFSTFPQYKFESLNAGKILGEKLFQEINSEGYIDKLLKDTDCLIKSLRGKNEEIITYLDELYPDDLRNIVDPPAVLYCKGNIEILNHSKKVAIVGTRLPTIRGLDEAQSVSQEFAREGYVIVSGLAKGIDTAAHKGALMSGGFTIAVLPGSLDNIYPRENVALAEDIIKNGGLLITEYPPETILQKRHFVARDRIQSGLSSAVIIIQTEIKGGAMHTANYARSQGRIVFCPDPDIQDLKHYGGIIKLLEGGKAIRFSGKTEEVIRTVDKIEQLTLTH